MTNDSIIEEINKIGESTAILARTAAEKAKDLELQRKRKLCEKRCSKHILNTLDFKKDRTFKRSNSYVAELEHFVDWVDSDKIQHGEARMKKSMQFERNKVNHKIWDVAETGIIDDPFHSETAEAVSNIDSGRSSMVGIGDHGKLKIGETIRDSRSEVNIGPMRSCKTTNMDKPAIIKLNHVRQLGDGTLHLVDGDPLPGD
jgi:hypothetical protein